MLQDQQENCSKLSRALRRLGTSNLVFEPSGVCLTAHVVQILLTAIMLGGWARSFSVIWWPAFDAARVLVSSVARMDFLLREQLQGQEAVVERDRRTVLTINALGLLYSPTIFAYKPFVTRVHLELAILSLVILFTHFLTSLPCLYHLLKGLTLDPEPEEANRPLLDSHSRGDSYDSASNSPALDAEVELKQPENEETSEPMGPSAMSIQQAIMNQIRSRGDFERRTEVSRSRDVRAQQDAEYEVMVAEERLRRTSTEKKEEKEVVSVELTPSPPRAEPIIAPLSPPPRRPPPPILPPEPSAGEAASIELRMKMLDGSTLQRRFPKTTKLEVIMRWVSHTAGEKDKDLQIATRMPRKVFSTDDFSKSIETLNVGSDVLFVELKS